MTKKMLLICFLIFITACSNKNQVDNNKNSLNQFSNNTNNSYPIYNESKDYPIPGKNITRDYPPPSTPLPIVHPEIVTPIEINKPISQGEMEITGSGPTNLPIVLVDITLNGEFISSTVINESGQFNFTLPPLESGHRYGIKIDSIDGITYNGEDYSLNGFQGTEPKLVPNIGYFFDSVLID